ncbi:MAG: hypothetical protein JWO07_417 [Candidatus Saccharibacteria bacterium]|nr:hypothetical protein [Candidatus Saccharibacteria bacterium]
MRADNLTKNQDEKYAHLPSAQLRHTEQAGTPVEPDFYSGSQLSSNRHDAGLGRGQADVANDVLGVRDGEERGSFIKSIGTPAAAQNKPAKIQQLFTGKNLRSKASMLTAVSLLVGGGGFMTVMFAPASAIVQMKEIFTQSFNDQLKAVDSRSTSLIKAKFKSGGAEPCGAVKIKCELGEMTDNEVKDFESKNEKIKINRTDIVDGKGKIASIVFTDEGKAPEVYRTADQFSAALQNSEGFRTAWGTVDNPTFKSVSDPTSREVFAKDKASKNYDLTGQNDEERQKKLNDIAGGQENIEAASLTKHTDKDGNTTYTDDSGHTLSQSQVDEAGKISDNASVLQKAGGLTGVVAGTAEKAVAVDSIAENTCSAWTGLGDISIAAKTVQKQQEIREALALVLTLADKTKAGDASEEATNFAGNILMKSQPDSQVIDDSKLSSPSTGKLPLISDPEKGGNAFDSFRYKVESSGIMEKMSSRASKFSFTGGSAAIIDAIRSAVSKVVTGGNSNPKAINKACGVVRNGFVRIGALGLGVVTGAATLGIATAVQAGLSVAWSIAQPAIEAKIGDIMTGNIVNNVYGLDAGEVVGNGTDALLSDIAQARGMPPVTDQAGMDYISQNRQTASAYNQDQQYLARGTPFDVNNRYSFLGSMLFNFTPTILESRQNTSVAMMNMASLIPTTFATISGTVHAANALPDEYFNSCPDLDYQSYSIKADPGCVVRHYMPQNSLNLDPLDNAQWMSDTGNIDPDSDTGEAKDNGQSWNYVKFMTQCVNRTQPYGDGSDEDQGDGSACYSTENEPLNMHFRTYTMDLSVDGGQKDHEQSTPITTGAGDNTKAKAGPNGWVFPTVASDLITRKFGDSGFTGVDLAGSSVALTNQQPIYAAKDGIVVAAGKADGYGNWVVIQHDADATGKVFYSVYGNIDDDGVLVSVNQKVKAGDQIAKIGSADMINGPHLRFEVWDGSPLAGGKSIDPTSIVEGARPVASGVST